MQSTTIPSFRKALLAWYDKNRRTLPWRDTRDPYAIWLSEVMLQQTTVRTVEPRWRRFLERWPTVRDLAASPIDDVLHEWTGLGYYARARNLHKAARVVAEELGGEIPKRFELLLALPGMGVYTAAAVASIAFGEPVPVVDANVERVIARLDAIDEDIKSASAKKTLRERAAALLAPRRAGDFNQAMMELGAVICLPRRPACTLCPVRAYCKAREEGTPEAYPLAKAKPDLEEAREAAILIERGGRVLLLKRPKEGSFGGMWELPRVRCGEEEESIDAARRAARDLTGLVARPVSPVFRCRHTVMRSRITLLVFTCVEFGGKPRAPEHEEARWVDAEEWQTLPKSTTQAKVAAFFAAERGAKSARKEKEKGL